MTRSFFILLLFAVAALAADPTVVTKTIKQSGGDYSSLAAWEAGMDDTGDLVSRNEISVASIEGDWSADDYSAVVISGWTTDATRFIAITNSTSKHNGKSYGSLSTAYRLNVTNATVFILSEEYTFVHGLQLKVSDCSTARTIVQLSPSAYPGSIVIGYCIITSSSAANGAAGMGLSCASTNTIYKVYNCIGHNLCSQDNVEGRFVNQNSAPAYCHVYNCTGFGNYSDYRGAGTCYSYNCISQNSVSASSAWVGTWTGGDYNVCSDGDDPPGSNPADQTVDVAFVSESGTLDLHLSAADSSGVKDATSDQSSGLFADDIDGVTRTGSWDIGADEYVAAAATSGKRVPFLKGLRR